MRKDKFKDKISRARNMFILEMVAGCNECDVDKDGKVGLCTEHAKVAMASYTKKCAPFQEFLKTIGLVKEKK